MDSVSGRFQDKNSRRLSAAGPAQVPGQFPGRPEKLRARNPMGHRRGAARGGGAGRPGFPTRFPRSTFGLFRNEAPERPGWARKWGSRSRSGQKVGWGGRANRPPAAPQPAPAPGWGHEREAMAPLRRVSRPRPRWGRGRGRGRPREGRARPEPKRISPQVARCVCLGEFHIPLHGRFPANRPTGHLAKPSWTLPRPNGPAPGPVRPRD